MPARRILIVDDEDDIREVAQVSLELLGHYEVLTASCGRDGLDSARTDQPDAILLDVMMPRIDGIELLKEIRGHPLLSTLPVLVYTNAFVPKLTEEAKLAGATDVFAKTQLSPKMLVEILDTKYLKDS